MITEDYCSFELAKLLKEKGFDGKCEAMYDKDGHFVPFNFKVLTKVDKRLFVADAPTLQMAMKWLREVHGLNVQPCIVRTIELKKVYNATIYDNNCEQIKSHFGRNIFDGFISYEEASEAAIKYCLTNLI